MDKLNDPEPFPSSVHETARKQLQKPVHATEREGAPRKVEREEGNRKERLGWYIKVETVEKQRCS